MKIKLNEALKSYDAYVNEKEVATEVETVAVEVETPGADSSRNAMIADVDSIITSLETLAGSVAEMVEEMNNFDNEVNEESEAINEGPVQWVKGKLLQGKQKKVTTMKLKSSDMSSAAAGLQGSDNRDKQSYIIDKKKQLDDSIKQLQAMIDDKAKDIGGPALKIVNREKLKGQMAVIKSQIGNVDPAKAKSMKDRLSDLQDKYKEEGEAIAQLRDKADANAQDVKGDDDTNALKDEIKKLQDEKKTIDKSTTKGELEAVMMDIKIYGLKMKKAVEDGDPKTDPSEFDDKIAKLKTKAAELQTELEGEPEPKEKDTEAIAAADAEVTKAKAEYDAVKDGEDEKVKLQAELKFKQAQQKKAKLEGDDELYQGLGTDIGAIMKKIDGEPEPKEPEPKEPEPKEPEPKDPKDPEPKDPKDPEPKDPEPKDPKDPEPKDPKDPKKKKVQDSLIIRANAAGLNELASEIDSKLDWQLAQGTGLRLKYESAIRKAESDKTLNESRYFDNNMKDAFRRLL